MMSVEQRYNQLGTDRITSRQIDELVGLARGIAADGIINQSEVEFLQKWLAANLAISDQTMISRLYDRVNYVLADGIADVEECRDLLDTLNSFADRTFELGEVMKPATLPLCHPAPVLGFTGLRYCFTGTFGFGGRRDCENEIVIWGGTCGTLTKTTNVLVVGSYATESWKHSSFGTKIVKAVDYRSSGIPISIVSEQHWHSHL